MNAFLVALQIHSTSIHTHSFHFSTFSDLFSARRFAATHRRSHCIHFPSQNITDWHYACTARIFRYHADRSHFSAILKRHWSDRYYDPIGAIWSNIRCLRGNCFWMYFSKWIAWTSSPVVTQNLSYIYGTRTENSIIQNYLPITIADRFTKKYALIELISCTNAHDCVIFYIFSLIHLITKIIQ